MPRFSANISMLFAEYDLPDRFAAASAAGFAAVEIQFPYGWDIDELVAAQVSAGVEVVLINLPAGDWQAGDRGLAAIPGREDEFRAGVAEARRYAVALGCERVNALAGVPRPGLDRARCLDTMAANLRRAAAALEAAGIRVLVEAINTDDVPGFLISSTDDAVAVIDQAGAPGLGLQYDAYHMQIMEGHLIPTLERVIGRVGHIQFADAPGRHEPGSGAIDFAHLFAAIDGLDYDGWVGAEYVPTARTEDSLGWLAGWRA